MTALLALALVVAAPAAPGAPAAASPSRSSPTEVVERVNRANAALATWSAHFVERRHFVHFNETETRSGVISFKRGTGIAIEVTEPEPERIVIRKERALQWLPRSRQLHRYELPADVARTQVSPIPFRFGEKGWEPAADHEVRILDAPGPEVVLELVPRQEGGAYVRKTIWLDPRTWLPVRLLLVESTDDEVTFAFSEVTVDRPLDDAQFEIRAAADAEVIDHKDLPSF